jgi:ankyrin repeat protein
MRYTKYALLSMLLSILSIQAESFDYYKNLQHNIRNGTYHTHSYTSMPWNTQTIDVKLLHHACFKNCLPSVRYLIAHKADINDSDNILKATPLCIALALNHLKVAQYLINEGAHIGNNTKDIDQLTAQAQSHGATLLYNACKTGNLDLVKKCIASGLDINTYVDNMSLVYCADLYGHSNIALELITSGSDINRPLVHIADINHTLIHVQDLLFQASLSKNDIAVKKLVQHILQNGLSIDNTPALCAASERGYTDIVKELAHVVPNINGIGPNTYTALHNACDGGHLKTVKELIAMGADVNKSDAWCTSTPLHRACHKGYTDIITELIQSNADINARDGLGNTALDDAIDAHCLPGVRELLKSGIDTTQGTGPQDHTPLYKALKNTHIPFAQLLLQYRTSTQGEEIPSVDTITHTQDIPYSSCYAIYEHLVYLTVFKGADERQINDEHIIKNLNIYHEIDEQYPHGSLSYTHLCQKLDPAYHDTYLSKLCIDGHYKSVFRIIEHMYEDKSLLHTIHKNSITHIIDRLSDFLVLTKKEMDLFVSHMYAYYKTHPGHSRILIETLIEHIDNMHNDLFIESCIRIYKEHINYMHSSLPSNIYIDKNMNLLEKAIWFDKENLVALMLQDDHININDMYMFYKKCQEDDFSSHDFTHNYDHPATKKYARWIFNLKHRRDLLSGTYKYIKMVPKASNKSIKPYTCVKMGTRRTLRNYIQRRLRHDLYRKRMSRYIRKKYEYQSSLLSLRSLPQEIGRVITSYTRITSVNNTI